MALPIFTPRQVPRVLSPARSAGAVVAIAAAGLGTALLVGALILWVHYGTAVFFEMVAAGIAACF